MLCLRGWQGSRDWFSRTAGSHAYAADGAVEAFAGSALVESTSVVLECTLDGGSLGSEHYVERWRVRLVGPSTPSTEALVRADANDLTSNDASDRCRRSFLLRAITSPNGGETLDVSVPVRTSRGKRAVLSGTYTIDLSLDAGLRSTLSRWRYGYELERERCDHEQRQLCGVGPCVDTLIR